MNDYKKRIKQRIDELKEAQQEHLATAQREQYAYNAVIAELEALLATQEGNEADG
jgi:formiminotetrahydrofolate cyclodeaminase